MVTPVTNKRLIYLERRRVRIDQIKCIGKESNSLENVESGLEHSEKNVYTEYVDPNREERSTKTLPALRTTQLRVIVEACRGHLSRSTIIDLRAGRSRLSKELSVIGANSQGTWRL